MYLKRIWSFCKKIFLAYSHERIASLSAALSYYTLFSLTPILLICIALVGIFFGQEATRGQVLEQISGIVGADTGRQIQTMIENTNKPTSALISKIIAPIILLIGAAGVFGEIQNGLNQIWGVKTCPDRGWFETIKDRLLSFLMVLGTAFLLLVSFALSVFLTAISSYLTDYLGLHSSDIFIAHLVSFLVVILLFAMMFKVLPDAEIRWREVWLGAFITALLFSFGKFLLGIYLNKVHFTSIFGAADSLVVLLIWVYYAAQIFFIGAAITQIISTQNRKVVPTRRAISLTKTQ